MHDAEFVELLCTLYLPQLLAHIVSLPLVISYLLECFVQLISEPLPCLKVLENKLISMGSVQHVGYLTK
jgi:hypothetical protein